MNHFQWHGIKGLRPKRSLYGQQFKLQVQVPISVDAYSDLLDDRAPPAALVGNEILELVG